MPSFNDYFESKLNAILPVGDPNELRRYAKTLLTRAERAGEVARKMDASMDEAGLLEGPLAYRLKAEGKQNASDYRRVAAQIQALSDYMERAASNLERDQQVATAAAARFANGKLLEDTRKGSG